jgi:hypothetical protein
MLNQASNRSEKLDLIMDKGRNLLSVIEYDLEPATSSSVRVGIGDPRRFGADYGSTFVDRDET